MGLILGVLFAVRWGANVAKVAAFRDALAVGDCSVADIKAANAIRHGWHCCAGPLPDHGTRRTLQFNSHFEETTPCGLVVSLLWAWSINSKRIAAQSGACDHVPRP